MSAMKYYYQYMKYVHDGWFLRYPEGTGHAQEYGMYQALCFLAREPGNESTGLRILLAN